MIAFGGILVDYDNLKIEGAFENDILILRDALMSELDTLSLYEKMLVGLQVEKAKAYMAKFIEEEKQHVAALTKLINDGQGSEEQVRGRRVLQCNLRWTVCSLKSDFMQAQIRVLAIVHDIID